MAFLTGTLVDSADQVILNDIGVDIFTAIAQVFVSFVKSVVAIALQPQIIGIVAVLAVLYLLYRYVRNIMSKGGSHVPR